MKTRRHHNHDEKTRDQVRQVAMRLGVPVAAEWDGDGVIIHPPASATVDEGRPVLYTHDERPIYRRAGYR